MTAILDALNTAINTDRDLLVEELNRLAHAYTMRAAQIKEHVKQFPGVHSEPGTVADSHRHMCPQHIARLLEGMTELIGPMENAKQALHMHDNPDDWRAEIERDAYADQNEHGATAGAFNEMTNLLP